MATTAIPDRGTFMKRSAERFRSVSRKFIEGVKKAPRRIAQAVKKAAGWVAHNKVTTAVVNTTKRVAAKVWKAAKPVAAWTRDYVLEPAAVVGAGVIGYVLAHKVLAVAAAGLGGLAIILFVSWLVGRIRQARRDRREVQETKTTDNVVPIKSAETSPVVEGEVVKTSAVKAEEKVEQAQAKVEQAQEALAEAKVEAKAEVLEAEVSGFAPRNGSYKVQLPDGDLDPEESLEDRYKVLERLADAEEAKGDQGDPEFLCELQARMNLIRVRSGADPEIKRDASVADIHRNYVKALEIQWTTEHGGVYDPHAAGHYGNALNRGAMAENGRLNKINRLKDKGKGSKAA